MLRTDPIPRRLAVLLCLTAAALSFGVPAASAQTLARKGWAGSGLTVRPWYQGVVLYQLDPAHVSDAERELDFVQSLDVGALVLSPAPSDPADPAADTLMRAANARGIRVLVDLPLAGPPTTQALSGLARSWLSRGAAGLHLTLAGAESLTPLQRSDRAAELNRLAASFAGQRVLLWDAPLAQARRRATNAQPAQLLLDARLAALAHLTAANLRQALTPLPQTASIPVPAATVDFNADAGTGAILAAALLAGPGSPLIVAAQSAPQDGQPTPLLAWVRSLGALRRARTALREGALDPIESGNADVVAWVRGRTPGNSPVSPVLIVCNVTDHPVHLSLAAELRRLGLAAANGSLHTLATSDGSIPSEVLANSLTLPSHAVFLGELGHAPGLESAPPPPQRSGRSR